jgi:cytochrome c
MVAALVCSGQALQWYGFTDILKPSIFDSGENEMKSMTLVVIAAGMLVAGPVAAQSGAELAKSKNCMACHDLEAKKMGPSFKAIAAKYKDDKTAEAKLVAALQTGKGHPSKVAATDAELKTLVQYVLSAK